MKLRKIFTSWRVILLICLLLLSLIAIHPTFKTEGVAIKNVASNSTAAFAGLQNPNPNAPLVSRERIIALNHQKTLTLDEYHSALRTLPVNASVTLQTNKQEYVLLSDGSDLGITIDKVATSNIKKGLELQGGSRVLLQPAEEITEQQREDLIAIMGQRLNTYGLSDISIRKADDLLGNKYIAVEIAGASKQEVKDLIESQGKFEAKIGNQTTFEGGEKDVTFVCKNDGSCSGIRQCTPANGGYQCLFEFQISLSGVAAKRQADITRNLPINISDGGKEYLAEPLDLYLDDHLVESLQISADLKGREATSILITGPGAGVTQEDALNDATKQMNKLQTILLTGSLPVKLNIIKLDSISPALGSAFLRNAVIAGLFAMLAVGLVIFLRYRKIKIAIPILITMLSELFITLGFAAFIKWNLDLASIAGMIAAIGTGVNDQIVIIDEVLSGEQYYKWKEKIRRAFFVIMAAYFATVAAMLPLFRAGAGMLTGFALVTIVGVSIGVFVTRPAYAVIIEHATEE